MKIAGSRAESTSRRIMEIPVRKLFWDAFEIAVEAQVHRLAKDIAAVLGEPDAPLLKALREEKVKVHLVEDATDETVEDLAAYRCKHYHRVGPVLRKCLEPVVWRTGTPLTACIFHSLHPSLKATGDPLLELDTDEGIFYVNTKTSGVHDSAGTLCGTMSDDGKKVSIFEVVG